MDLHPIAKRVLCGSIRNVDLAVLGDHCPDSDKLKILDAEQTTRLYCAAVIQEYVKKFRFQQAVSNTITDMQKLAANYAEWSKKNE